MNFSIWGSPCNTRIREKLDRVRGDHHGDVGREELAHRESFEMFFALASAARAAV
jgi:hypothetical protein